MAPFSLTLPQTQHTAREQSTERRERQASPLPVRGHLLTTRTQLYLATPGHGAARLLCARKPRTTQAASWKPLTHDLENQRTSEAPSSNRRGSRWDKPPRATSHSVAGAQSVLGKEAGRTDGLHGEFILDYNSHHYRRRYSLICVCVCVSLCLSV